MPCGLSSSALARSLRRPYAFCAIAGAVAVLPYLGVLGFAHVYDDHWTLIGNPALEQPLHSLLLDLIRGRSTSMVDASRPTMVISNWIDRNLWASSPVATHATNLFLYALSAVSGYALAWTLLRDRHRALLAAILWSVWPGHAEAVACANYREDLFAAIGVFGTLSLLLVPMPKAHSGRRSTAVLGLATLAFFAKESALIVVPIFIALAERRPASLIRRERSLITLLCLLIFYGAWRYGLSLEGGGVPRSPVSLVTSFQNTPRYWVWSVITSALPVPGQPVYEARAPASSLWLVASVLVVLGLAMSAKRWPRLRAPIVILALGALFTSPLVGPINVRADRYLLVSSLGAAMVWSELCFRIQASRRVRLAMVGVVVVGLTIGTSFGARVWRDDRALWQAATEQAPHSAKAWTGLAWTHRQFGQFTASERALDRALMLEPNRPSTRLSAAYLALRQGRRAQAVAMLDALGREAQRDGTPLRGLARAQNCAANAAQAEMAHCLGDRP